VCFDVGRSVCEMITISSFCFLCCMVLVVVWFVLHFRIRVYCLKCVMPMLRLVICFEYLVISQCRIPIDLTVWPTYELLHVLHFNLCMPLEFILFIGILSRSWL
jgi:hypothetical protein